MEKWWCLYGETTVSLRRNCGVPPQKLSFPAVETVISNAGNDSSPPGNGKLMYTINFCTHGELALQGLYCVADTLICNLSATVSATLQLFINQCITRVWLQVADVFMFFQLYGSSPKLQIKTIMTPYHLVRCHNLNRTMPRNRSHNGMMKLH